MSKSSFKYGFIEEVEDLEGYEPGGYHPIHIDDRLKERYRILDKLGHGSYCTAWLAIDEDTSKYVAVKVGTAYADRAEIRILSRLTESVASCGESEGKLSPIPIVLDHFDLHGPNGTHPCLVTPPANCSVLDAREASNSALFPLDVARSLAAQLVTSVSLVHSQGYAHGDLHIGNLLLQFPSSLNSLSIEQLYERYGEPQKEPVIRLDTKAPSTDPRVPSYAVPPMWLGELSHKIKLHGTKLILSDFGTAFRLDDNSRFESYTPIILRHPEAIFEPTTPLTFASDIWSLGCVIFELLAHRSLIDGMLATQDYVTTQQVHLQGIMPQEWWAKWENRPKFFDEEAGPRAKDPYDIWPWERRFEKWLQAPRREVKMETLSEKEQDALLKLLRWMIAWKPSERPDIKAVLESDWMTQWALPAFQRSLEPEPLALKHRVERPTAVKYREERPTAIVKQQ